MISIAVPDEPFLVSMRIFMRASIELVLAKQTDERRCQLKILPVSSRIDYASWIVIAHCGLGVVPQRSIGIQLLLCEQPLCKALLDTCLNASFHFCCCCTSVAFHGCELLLGEP